MSFLSDIGSFKRSSLTAQVTNNRSTTGLLHQEHIISFDVIADPAAASGGPPLVGSAGGPPVLCGPPVGIAGGPPLGAAGGGPPVLNGLLNGQPSAPTKSAVVGHPPPRMGSKDVFAKTNWSKLTRVSRSAEGSGGVAFVEFPDGKLVIKSNTTVAQEAYASRVSAALTAYTIGPLMPMSVSTRGVELLPAC
jgi:hypothetical protein